ncbi:ABC transporter permease subunit [candidate division KSB3 bacterium]|jgi:ABC-type glycerol-3-phosphate transport system permease component|uniref:ABC transporter permease subunit n=1 Tax=candidate division KSB3 bacterium TaxID=2044937 RepID=A0A9D5Q6F9_9BACT|nr:ABC transporter permease subunit [candidate division KSB3 bacterium]MBD3325710.1 ABC transporter permease subunit [candidate division KSB3 bacterium]
MREKTFAKIVRFTLIYLALIVFVAPLVWMFSTSFKTEADAFRYPPVFFSEPTLNNYKSVLQSDFPRSILNSIVVCLSTVGISIVLGTPAAYALSRYNFRHKKDFAMWILSTRMAPQVAVALPMFLMMKAFRLLDTPLALVVLYTTFNLSFVIWMMRGFFEEVPRELDEAALIDGCSQVHAFIRIALPLVAPGLVAAGIFCFIFSWNEFYYALIMTRSDSMTVPVAVQGFIGLYGIRWGEMTAAAVLATAPILVFAIATQKHLVRGLTLGAIK